MCDSRECIWSLQQKFLPSCMHSLANWKAQWELRKTNSCPLTHSSAFLLQGRLSIQMSCLFTALVFAWRAALHTLGEQKVAWCFFTGSAAGSLWIQQSPHISLDMCVLRGISDIGIQIRRCCPDQPTFCTGMCPQPCDNCSQQGHVPMPHPPQVTAMRARLQEDTQLRAAILIYLEDREA